MDGVGIGMIVYRPPPIETHPRDGGISVRKPPSFYR